MNPEIKTKLLKVTLEYEDKIMTIEGTEAEKWNEHNLSVAQLAQIHNINPFKDDPINWNVVEIDRLATVHRSGENWDDPIIVVTLADGYEVKFWLTGLTDQEYIRRAQLIKSLEQN
jgi:hypothetical protein